MPLLAAGSHQRPTWCCDAVPSTPYNRGHLVLSELGHLMCRSQLLALFVRGDAAKDLEILVLRHQPIVLPVKAPLVGRRGGADSGPGAQPQRFRGTLGRRSPRRVPGPATDCGCGASKSTSWISRLCIVRAQGTSRRAGRLYQLSALSITRREIA